MKCTYPSCRQVALWQPVIAIPTIRTVGVSKPELSPMVSDYMLMHKYHLDPAMHIRMYEARLKEWKATQNNIVQTDEPTLLIGTGICQLHRDRYNFLDWFGAKEWDKLCDAARDHGVVLETSVTITFRSLDWLPGAKYLEMDR